MKRILTFGAGIALCIAAISQPLYANEITLRFSWWGGGDRHDATLEAIKAYEAKNPGIKILPEYSGILGYQEKLAGQLASNTEPDIMQLNWTWLGLYSREGNGFYDLRTGNAIKLADFMGESWRWGLVNNKLNALPASLSTRILLWNKTTWDKAGKPLPKTWEELFSAGPLFNDSLGKEYFPLDGQLYDRIMLAHAYTTQKTGKAWITPNKAKVAYTEEEALEWVKCFSRLVTSHIMPPLQYRLTTGGGTLERPTEQLPDWVSGKIAGDYTMNANIRQRINTAGKGNTYEVGDMLTMPGMKHNGIYGYPPLVLSVSKNSKHPEVAARFVNWLLTDTEAAKIQGITRGVPLSKTQFDAIVNAKNNPLKPIEIKTHKQVLSLPIDPPSHLMDHGRLQQWLRDVFEKIAQGGITQEQGAKLLVEEGNILLRKLQ